MKTLQKILLLSIAIIVATSCNNAASEVLDPQIANLKITQTNLPEVTEQIAKSNVSIEEIEHFINALKHYSDTRDSLIGKTVGQVIAEQKSYLKEQVGKALVGTGTRVNLFFNHKFKYIGIKFQDEDPKQKINNFIFEVTNTSGKEIKRIEGTLAFYTQSGSMVKVYSLGTGAPIPPSTDGKGAMFGMPFVHDDNLPNDVLMRTNKELQAVWTPRSVEFSDGTKFIDVDAQ